MRSLIIIIGAWTAFAVGDLPGRAGTLDRTTTGEDVTVAMTSPFSQLPPSGYAPFRVNIRNDRNSSGSWHLIFSAGTNYSLSGTTVLEQDFTVAANSSGTFDLLIPLPSAATNHYGNATLSTRVIGSGFNNSSMNIQAFASIYTNNPRGGMSPFTLIGKDLLGSTGISPVENMYQRKKREFYGSEVDHAALPSDWRAYSGAAVILLKDSEWLDLSRSQREAISDYVAQGGQLVLFTDENPDTKTPQLQLPESDGKPGPYGFGTILLASTPTIPPDVDSFYDTIEHHHAVPARQDDQNFSNWDLRVSVGVITVSVAFILTFVLLFGILIGPVNLFVFARGSRRFRLFWTTPLISIVASLILIAGILMTDGLGGDGKQMIAIYSLPGSSSQAVIQEQVARTAVLFSNRWSNDQNYLITPVSDESMGGALIHDNPGHYHVANRNNSTDSYHQEGNELSGSWFHSRAVSGQYLQAMRPSRSVLTVLNSDALSSSSEPPVLLSSFPQELSEVYLVDMKGSYWTCENLEPGQKKACTASSVDAYGKFWKKATALAGGKLRPALQAAAWRHGCFYATGSPSASETLATLPEIRWHVESGVYLGPWVASPATTPENGP